MVGIIGQSVADRYRIERLLGQGGMGMIYEAEDRQTGTMVAIKVMHDHLAHRAQFRDRFVQEAQSVADLDHPNIVRVLDHSPGAERLFIVMELVSGGSLRDYINHVRTPFALADATYITAQIAEALHYAHEHNVIHRDVKPENILLQPTSRSAGGFPYHCMLTDFGLAKLTDNIGYTLTGRPFGTFPYMSPEQCKAETVDRRTDIYALGIVLFELTTGKLPYEPQTIFEAYKMHVEAPLPEPHHFRGDMPNSLQQIMLTCLAKKREARYQTALDLARDLRKVSLDLQGGYITEAGAGGASAPPPQTLPPSASSSSIFQRPQPPTASVPSAQPVPPAQSVASLPSARHSTVPPSSPPSYADLSASGVRSAARPVPQALRVDSIYVSDGANGEHIFPIEHDRVRIGRAPKMDIVLGGRYVSREHAILERRSDGSYWIRGTGSLNPCLLEGNPVGSERASHWQYGQTVTIGEATLTLTKAMDAFGDAGMMDEFLPPFAGENGFQAEGQTIRVDLKPRNQLVSPGGETVFTVVIVNTGKTADQISLQVRGIPAEWSYIEAEIINISAGAQVETAIRFSPPRDASSRASRHTFTLRAHSLKNRLEICKIGGMLHLEPFQNFTVTMHPKRLQNGGIIRLRIRNEGNTRADFHVDGIDTDDALTFVADPPILTVEPGESAEVRVDVVPKMDKLVHGARAFNFTLSVRSAEGVTERLEGELVAVTNLLYQQQRLEQQRIAAIQAPIDYEPGWGVWNNQAPAQGYYEQDMGYDQNYNAGYDDYYDPAPASMPVQSDPNARGLGLTLWLAACSLIEFMLFFVVLIQAIRIFSGNFANFASLILFCPLLIFSLIFTILYGITLIQAWRWREWAVYTLLILSAVFGIIVAQSWDWQGSITLDIILTVTAILFGITVSAVGWFLVRPKLHLFS
ncbi:MAG: protein kinase [Aggregatilineales bacterium]